MEQQWKQSQGELQIANRKITNLKVDLDNTTRRNQDLSDQVKDNEKEMRKMRGNFDRIKTKALLGSAVQVENRRSMRDGPTSGASFGSGRPLNQTPPGNQPPQPFVPTPDARQPIIYTTVQRKSLPSPVCTPRQPDFQQAHVRSHKGNVSRAFKRESDDGSRQPLVAIDLNGTSNLNDGKRGLSKLAQRKVVGPADFGGDF